MNKKVCPNSLATVHCRCKLHHLKKCQGRCSKGPEFCTLIHQDVVEQYGHLTELKRLIKVGVRFCWSRWSGELITRCETLPVKLQGRPTTFTRVRQQNSTRE